MTAAPIDNIIQAILNGQVDENLDAILGAVKDRRKIKARGTFHTVKKGDKATLRNLRPLYMVGVPVTIVSKNQTRIVVDVDPEYAATHDLGRFRSGRSMTVTPDMLEFTASEAP